jgi:hypothetical protein
MRQITIRVEVGWLVRALGTALFYLTTFRLIECWIRQEHAWTDDSELGTYCSRCFTLP